MNTRSVHIHRLAKDPAAFRLVVQAVRSAPNGELRDMERAIAAFEAKHRMSSAEARARVESGELAPTREIEAWMMALRVRDDLADLKAAR
jgi:hypothetical protein